MLFNAKPKGIVIKISSNNNSEIESKLSFCKTLFKKVKIALVNFLYIIFF